MGRFIVIVLDGFGVGYMEDAARVRPADVGANTFGSIAKDHPQLRLPTLESLGLMNIAGFELANMKRATRCTIGKANLTHFGADTYWGHQEIMGTKPQKPGNEPLAPYLERVKQLLTESGYTVRVYQGEHGRFLIVNEAVTVADNIETDPGLAVNVTAALDHISFEEELRIGRLIRSVVTASRVIVFGGRRVNLQNLLDAVEEKEGGFIGVSAPKSGVYVHDYQCVHLGYGVNPETQVPHLLQERCVPSFLLGKAADIIHNPTAQNSFSMVPTTAVLDKTVEIMGMSDNCFICANVQETDLAGHRQDSGEYLRILTLADQGIAKVMAAMHEKDILVVMADHGNDPNIGHPQHTREQVPLMMAGAALRPVNIGVRPTLSDVAASAADYFGAQMPQQGESFLSLIYKEAN